jgi:Na+/H+ antiporter NhaA
MTFFFFIIGLEARREFDMGELRERRRVALRLAAGIGGMIVPVAIYLALNAGHPSAHGWGVAMSTDTAFALGLLALVGRRLPDSVRAFLLTVVVVGRRRCSSCPSVNRFGCTTATSVPNTSCWGCSVRATV